MLYTSKKFSIDKISSTALGIGTSSLDVSRAKLSLAYLGYYKAADLDGYYSPSLKTAVLTFEKRYGLRQDGYLSSQDITKLKQEVPDITVKVVSTTSSIHPANAAYEGVACLAAYAGLATATITQTDSPPATRIQGLVDQMTRYMKPDGFIDESVFDALRADYNATGDRVIDAIEAAYVAAFVAGDSSYTTKREMVDAGVKEGIRAGFFTDHASPAGLKGLVVDVADALYPAATALKQTVGLVGVLKDHDTLQLEFTGSGLVWL
jgi:peptidoglycan hydrolase-like protein with peptidoglycan-binding domain